MAERFSFFATCAPGVEPVLHAEAKALRLAKIERQVGGVYFEGTLADAWRANLWLRTAVRVLLRVARFACRDEAELYDGAREVDWARFLAPEGRLIVDAQGTSAELAHTRFVEQRVKDAIVDGFRERGGARPSVGREEADLGVHVHLVRERCTLAVDTSGEALHKRGWRREQGRAPLAETLAAACVALAGWDLRSPLLDPFAGSGTIAIEAALAALGVAPGLYRERFGFERWVGHDAAAFERERERAREASGWERAGGVLRVGGSRRAPIVIGSDHDPVALEGARANARAAGLEGRVAFEPGDARELAPRPGWNAWIVSNLPYGRRVGSGRGRGEDQLETTYRRFGAALRERCAGYRVALLCADDPLRGALGLAGASEIALVNGGLDCRLVCATIGG